MTLSQFRIYCPICSESVDNAVLGHGSLENLRKDKGDVAVVHPTNDRDAPEHRWIADPQTKINLRKYY